MLIPVLTLATAFSLSLGTDGAAMAEVPATPAGQSQVAPATRPQFSLGAGDALGARIRVNDIVLARRLGFEPVQHATVPVQD